MSEDLLRRLRRADPARDPSAPPFTSVRDLMEAAMQSTQTQSTQTQSTQTQSTQTQSTQTQGTQTQGTQTQGTQTQGTQTTTPRAGAGGRAPLTRRWPAAAAAATLVIGGAAGAAFLTGDDPTPPAASVMELTLPGSEVMSSCIQYSVELLAQMPVAFSGEVVEAGAGAVVLDVDRWYRGGEADTVALVDPSGPMTSIDGVELVAGRRYLVTATEEGAVSSCGFTAEWSPAMAADFERAFAE